MYRQWDALVIIYFLFLSHANEQIVREGVDGRGRESEIIYFEISRLCEHLRCPNGFSRQFMLLYVKINTDKKYIFGSVCMLELVFRNLKIK